MPTSSNETMQLAALEAGEALLSGPSPLTRLNYFDGKLLRADDLKVEQSYVRTLVALSNQAGGTGVVHGYDTELASGDSLQLGAGLAIDPLGRLLLLPESVALPIAGLIEASQRLVGESIASGSKASPAKNHGRFGDCEPATGRDPATRAPSDLYLVWLSHAEDFCGHEDVYGALCDAACATTVARRFIVEGVLVFVTPLSLSLPLLPAGSVAASARNLRSRVASAYFALEAAQAGSLISRAGLLGNVWCLGARLAQGRGVPIAVLGRSGQTTTFLDAWTARRERMQAPAQSYWAGRMGMRPWQVFLAQVLQFQCQLPGIFRRTNDPRTDDPCADKRVVIGDAAQAVRSARDYFATVVKTLASANLSSELLRALKVDGLREQIAGYEALGERLTAAGTPAAVTRRLLIEGGILETPSAGYLPVDPSANLSVNEQVRRLLGDGVDLRFCVVRPDFVPHALEEAQHMERISLVEGLADPTRKPRVDVLVPDGEIVSVEEADRGSLFAMRLAFSTITAQREASAAAPAAGTTFAFNGAARAGAPPQGGGEFFLAGVGELGEEQPKVEDPEPAVEIGEVVRAAARARILKVAQAARVHTVARAAARPIPPGETIRTRIDGLPASAVAVEDSSRVFATWFEGRVTSDPFSLGLGQAAPLFGRLVTANPQPTPILSDLSLAGQLHFQNSFTQGRTRTVVCVLKGQVTRRVSSEGHSDTNSSAAEFAVKLVHSDLDGSKSLEITSGFPFLTGRQVRIRTKWTDAGTLAKAVATILAKEAGAERPFFSLSLKEDATVGEATNERHTMALRGLDVLEAVLDEPTFREGAERALFPPVSVERRVQIRAHRDWVLFHRRREKQCGPEERLAAPQRRYRVYLARLSPQLAMRLLSLLKSGAAEKRNFAFDELSNVVEFAGGKDDLISSPSALLSALAQEPHGDHLIASVIAIAGEARSDSNALTFARLKRLEAVVAPVLSPSETLVSEVLPEVPEALLPSAGADGVVLLVSTPLREQPAPGHKVAMVGTEGGKIIGNIARAVTFENDVPNAVGLKQFLESLAQVNFTFNRLVLFTPDEGATSAQVRLERVLESTGRSLRTDINKLTEESRKDLPANLADAAEIIHFETTRVG